MTKSKIPDSMKQKKNEKNLFPTIKQKKTVPKSVTKSRKKLSPPSIKTSSVRNVSTPKHYTQNTNIKEWNKQIKRIRKIVSEFKDIGFDMSGFKFPITPNRITQQSIDKVKNITKSDILEKGRFHRIIDNKIQEKGWRAETAIKHGWVDVGFRPSFKEKIKRDPIIVKKDGTLSKNYYIDSSTGEFVHKWSKEGRKLFETEKQLTTNTAITDETKNIIGTIDDIKTGEISYTQAEWEEISSTLKAPSYETLPQESEIIVNAFRKEIDFLDGFYQPDNLIDDEDVYNWDNFVHNVLNVNGTVYIEKKGKRININPKTMEDLERRESNVRQRYMKILEESDTDEIIQRISENRERLSELLEIIMYKAYEDQEVQDAINEFYMIMEGSI